MPTPVGLLISAHNSLFLLNGEQLTRIWGKPGWRLFGGGEYAYNVRLSPNGCKAVFGRVADWNPETWKPISIISLCKGE